MVETSKPCAPNSSDRTLGSCQSIWPSVASLPPVTSRTAVATMPTIWSITLRGGASPAFRGLMTWSINWDRYYNWEFQNSHAPYLAALP